MQAKKCILIRLFIPCILMHSLHVPDTFAITCEYYRVWHLNHEPYLAAIPHCGMNLPNYMPSWCSILRRML